MLQCHCVCAHALQALPQGLAGFVGMLRNWTFTLFFCMSELWGDVCMGLLFWGLANEITSLSDAATLYPLFGLGANLAQALAGVVLKVGGGVRHLGKCKVARDVVDASASLTALAMTCSMSLV